MRFKNNKQSFDTIRNVIIVRCRCLSLSMSIFMANGHVKSNALLYQIMLLIILINKSVVTVTNSVENNRKQYKNLLAY